MLRDILRAGEMCFEDVAATCVVLFTSIQFNLICIAQNPNVHYKEAQDV